ncbi:MAG TPA: helix-turn-helix transcriptional regulator, partial [Kofleriaceae bacterium]
AALPTLANTAAALRLSPRTLQRRLRDSGTAHSELVDQVRRSLALKYVGDAGLSITEIGYILHFSDTTAFSRAFKRWTGVLPRRYRERVLFDQMSPQARARRAS